jgi:DNA invertase Pin-like site-specific DNA recombinase/peptidoglycan hydrolase-like protein with peptidoglycan-binding domain
MSIMLAAVRGHRKTAVLLALATVVALAITAAPASARTTTTNTQVPELAQGAGMGDNPSPAVRHVQRVLDRRGYDLGAPGVDGRFGPITDAAVRRMQADNGLVVDGIVGKHTRTALGLPTTHRASKGGKTERGTSRPSSAKKTKGRTKVKTKAKPTAPAAGKQPASSPASTNTNHDNGGIGDLALLAIIALAAFVVSLLAFLVRASRRTSAAGTKPADPTPSGATGRTAGPPGTETTAVTSIGQELFLEGHNDDVGEFRGRAVASSVTHNQEDPDHPHTNYLIDDPRLGAPVWVREDDVHRSPSRLAAGEPVIGYVTLPAEAPASYADPSTTAIGETCEQAGWQLVDVVTDRETGRGLERPGLTYALRQIADGHARGLVISDLRRLSRSIVDLGALMEWFRDADAALVALDLGVDTSTPAGRELAATLIRLGGWERDRIARRTRSGLAGVRAQGGPTSRASVADRPELTERIIAMRSNGMTLQAISDQLNAEQVPTMRGGAMWRPSSVQAALGYRRPGSRSPRDQLPSLEEDRQR